ncbi:redoxin domain-containing protein [Kineosporia sp. J2-2]|uniref:Redoxin domain-containing protein n=1 Tax=Kineosporia corallincola TaxID=2835133 RepID=A0ABS5TRZ9_9ACTN|nr:thioredoxin-like domain-containing protein [Kineosporia corallincola]MBT0773559.1 redoxin domain-containing protein [Kineosporia corallincola]
MRVRAPRLRGRGWLNSPGLSLEELRGRFVLLDFWTSACVNCVHVIEELRPLEERYAGLLTVIGVHSPKFPHEATSSAVAGAVERYRVRHPVLDDPDLLTWDSYAVNAWPTLVLVDPRGYVVAQVSGEGHVAELAGLIDELRVLHAGELPEDAGAGDAVTRTRRPVAPGGADLRFPGGLLALPPGPASPDHRILVSDTGNQRLLLTRGDSSTVIGSGERGLADGPASAARFADPLGLALLPPEAAARAGYDVVIADSGNDALRGLRLHDLSTVTVATGISTPGDVAWFDGRIVVAVTGRHQLWGVDPVTGSTHVYAGTGKEGLVDGPAAGAWFAQPSGLSVGAGGLWVADAESSALRLVWTPDDGPVQVRTAVGQGLFEFGREDGDGWDARLQHPLGVQVLPDGTVAVADTFNGSVRRYDPVTDQVSTLHENLGEPSALIVVHHQMHVADAARHQVHRLGLETGPAPANPAVRLPVHDVNGGTIRLDVAFSPPPGEEVDLREGDQTWLGVTAHPPTLLRAGAGGGSGLTRELTFDDRISGGRTDGWLLVEARAASCDVDQGPGAVCYLHRRRWELPVRLIPGTATVLELVL